MTARLPLTVGDDRFQCMLLNPRVVCLYQLPLGPLGPAGPAGQLPNRCLVRVHSACLTGDVFGSKRCDCGDQLANAKAKILEEGAGLLLYMLEHEGRGIGLANKLCAYNVQDQRRLDTLDANTELGLPVDSRDYADAIEALRHFGLSHIRLLTNNPAKIAELQAAGITVERVSLCTTVHAQNEAYIRAKVDRLGHLACGS